MKETEIERMIRGSQLREIADFIADPESKITDCILCYQSEDYFGYKIVDGSSLSNIRGLLGTADEQVKLMIDMLLNPIEDENIDNLD